MNIENLAKKYKEELNADEMKLLIRDLDKLSAIELEIFVEVLKNTQPPISKPKEHILTEQNKDFIKEITVFFDTVVEKHGDENSQTVEILEQYNQEFQVFTKTLASFPILEIKEILFLLDNQNTHSHGGKIAEYLITHLENTLSDVEFVSIIMDSRIGHLY